MTLPKEDTPVSRLSKRINHLLRVTKGGKGNTMHALDMILDEMPDSNEREEVISYMHMIETRLLTIDSLVKELLVSYEQLKETHPDYKVKFPRKKSKRKAKEGK